MIVELLTVLSLVTPNVNLNYTEDSVVKDGVTYEIVENENSTDLKINIDLSLGYVIYDNPETEYIDGIQVNDEWLSDYVIENYNPKETYNIKIKTVYKDGLEGTLAKILDGTYDYTELLSNPIIILQMVYYILSVLAIIIGGVGFSKNRKLKFLTSKDIASNVEAKAKEFKETSEAKLNEFKDMAVNSIENILTPIVNKLIATNTAVIKSVVLANSKAENASIELLNVLKEVSDIDTESIIKSAKESIYASLDKSKQELENKEIQKQSLLETLKEIETVKPNEPKAM